MNCVINEVQKSKYHGDESFIIPPDLFGITKPFTSIEIPYCELNKITSKQICKIFQKFTNDDFRVVITRKSRNIRSLFTLKDKNDYKSCIINKGDCSCGSYYTGEAKRNAKIRCHKHNNPIKSSEASKHLRNNIDYCFTGLLFQIIQKY